MSKSLEPQERYPKKSISRMFGSVKTCHQDAEKSTPQETEGLASEIQHCQGCITQHGGKNLDNILLMEEILLTS